MTNSHRPQIPAPFIRNTIGQWARTNQEKTDLFARHLSKVFEPYSGRNDPEIDDLSSQQLVQEAEIPLTTPVELKEFIKKSARGSAWLQPYYG